MKKAIALILSLLVAFSMFAVVAAAEGEAATKEMVITFVYQTPGETEDDAVTEGKTITQVTVADDTVIPATAVPEIVTSFKGINKDDGKKYEYSFKGWRSSADGELYYNGTIKFGADAPSEVTMTAEYSMEDISDRQSFWNLVESIFERINLIFEYFAKIFNW